MTLIRMESPPRKSFLLLIQLGMDFYNIFPKYYETPAYSTAREKYLMRQLFRFSAKGHKYCICVECFMVHAIWSQWPEMSRILHKH